jgi:hypothetical protein
VAGGHLDVVKYISSKLQNVPDGAGNLMPCGHIKGGTIATAAFLGFPEIIEYYDKGINWNEETLNNKPRRLIQELFAVAIRGNARAAELIMDHTNVDINLCGIGEIQDNLLLHLVPASGWRVIEVLLNRPDIQVNITNSFGETALMLAAHGDNSEVADLLCKHKDINIHLRNNLGHTAFDIAVLEGSAEVVKVMLKQHDIQVNAPMRIMRWDETALIAAVRNRHVDVVKTLLADDRVDRDAKDVTELTALDIARRLDHGPLISLLDGQGSVDFSIGEHSLDDEYTQARSLMMYLRI